MRVLTQSDVSQILSVVRSYSPRRPVRAIYRPGTGIEPILLDLGEILDFASFEPGDPGEFLGLPVHVSVGEVSFVGDPLGHECSSLLYSLIIASTGEGISVDLSGDLAVMVTTSCPFCPYQVSLAMKMAQGTPGLRAFVVVLDAVEGGPELAKALDINAVPATFLFRGEERIGPVVGTTSLERLLSALG